MEDLNTLESIASWALQQAVRLDWWAAPPLASLSETSLEHWSAWRLEMKLLHFPDEKQLHYIETIDLHLFQFSFSYAVTLRESQHFATTSIFQTDSRFQHLDQLDYLLLFDVDP